MTTALQLELVDGPDIAPGRWRLAHGFRIGRAEGSGIELPDISVSRQHVVFESDRDGWNVRDCGSQLGSLLNELPLRPGELAALHPGDVVAVGAWRFRVTAAGTDVARHIESEHDDGPAVDVVDPLGSLAEQRLELLLRCAGEVAAADDEQALADALAEHALLGSGYARAAVLWKDGTDLVLRSLRPVAATGDTAFRFNRSLITSAESGEVARIEAGAEALARDRSERPTRRALCAPLMLDGHAEAFLYLDSSRGGRRGHTDAPTFVHALTRLGALALSNLRRMASERERATLAADIDQAREVQRRLLPDDRVPLGGVTYALHLHPGRAVAGDIADVIALADGGVAALLGDVSGAGLGAGLVMASVQSFLRAEFGHHRDPARAMTRLNRHLHAQSSGGRFVTLWLGVFDPRTRRCDFVDAGHGHALCIGGDRPARAIAARGDIPLGIDLDALFATETLAFADDELVVLYSDGVVERRAQDGRSFGRDRLIASITAAPSASVALSAALGALAEHAGATAPDDDMTVLVLEWQSPRESMGPH